MMDKSRWKVWFGIGLVMLSAALYGIHYLLFQDAHHILLYLVGDIAFVPIEVLLVTLILHKLLEVHEKQAMLNKMNMAIGIFFSEMGTELLVRLQEFDTDTSSIRGDLCARADGTLGEFDGIVKKYANFAPRVNCRKGDLPGLKEFLTGKRQFVLGLLGNPNLLEHDTFTGLLVVEWIAYMKHLQKDYPYLFSLAMRTNPFDSCAKVEFS